MNPDVTPWNNDQTGVFHSHILERWRSLGFTARFLSDQPAWGAAAAPHSILFDPFPLKMSGGRFLLL